MSYLFDAANEKLSTATVPVSAVGFTMMAWFRPTTIPPTGSKSILMIGTDASANTFFRLGLQNATTNVAAIQDAAGTNASGTRGTTAQAAWQLGIAIFTSDSSRTANLNGVDGTESTSTISTSWAGINKVTVGISTNDGLEYEGHIAHVAVWNRILSGGEKTALASGGNPMAASGGAPVWYCPLTSDANDIVGTNHLTVSGATLDTGENPTVDALPGGSRKRILMMGAG